MVTLSKHRSFFDSQQTLSISWRKKQLNLLLSVIERYEADLLVAFEKDLHKNKFESISTEIGIVKRNIKFISKNLNKWMKLRKTKTPLLLFGRTSYTLYEPYGTVLIIGPYNYPFLATIDPLIGAIASGNTAVIKPSEQTPHVSKVIQEMIQSAFEEDYIQVELGELEKTQELLQLKFDLIFFTGSQRVGKIILEHAAKNLTPVILELGGKSPVIVLKDADIKLTAKRIIWGKLLNAGQVCIAPDYCLVHKSIKDQLIEEMKNAVIDLYGKNAELSNDYGRIVSENHANRLATIIDVHKEEIIYGGNYKGTYIEPTLINLESNKGKVMEEEIFGPILPIISFESIEEIYETIRLHPKPLAMYIFGKRKSLTRQLGSTISSGGTMINDVIVYAGNEYLPFGGTGSSGMGKFHGKHSIRAFSHEKPITNTWFHGSDKLLSAPYTKSKLNILKKVFK